MGALAMPTQNQLLAAAAAVLAAFVLGAWGAWAIQTVRLNHAVDKINLEHSTRAREATQAALNRYQTLERTKDEAIAAHAELAAKNAVSAASAKRATDSLRRDLSGARDRIAAASRAAVDQYAIATGELLGACAAEYQWMAEIADGHAADAGLMRAAWPK